MKLEEQVCSLELSEKLKTLNIKQESLWHWQHNITGVRKGQKDGSVPYMPHSTSKEVVDEESIENFNDDYSGDYRTERYSYSAFTVAELGKVLPKDYCSQFNGDQWMCFKEEPRIEFANTEANAKAKMLILLKKQEKPTVKKTFNKTYNSPRTVSIKRNVFDIKYDDWTKRTIDYMLKILEKQPNKTDKQFQLLLIGKKKGKDGKSYFPWIPEELRKENIANDLIKLVREILVIENIGD